MEHSFELPADRPIMEERIVFDNVYRRAYRTCRTWKWVSFCVIGDKGRQTSCPSWPATASWPFRSCARSDDAQGRSTTIFPRPISFTRKATRFGIEVGAASTWRVPSDRRPSEGWAWTHGDYTLGIFKFCQENLQFSVVSTT